MSPALQPLFDQHGQPQTLAEALNELEVRRAADARAIVSLLVSAGIVTPGGWNRARVLAGAVIDQEMAAKTARTARRIEAMPHEYEDPSDAAEERAQERRAPDPDDVVREDEVRQILEEVKRNGWKAVTDATLAAAIDHWTAEAAKQAFGQGIETFNAMSGGQP